MGYQEAGALGTCEHKCPGSLDCNKPQFRAFTRPQDILCVSLSEASLSGAAHSYFWCSSAFDFPLLNEQSSSQQLLDYTGQQSRLSQFKDVFSSRFCDFHREEAHWPSLGHVLLPGPIREARKERVSFDKQAALLITMGAEDLGFGVQYLTPYSAQRWKSLGFPFTTTCAGVNYFSYQSLFFLFQSNALGSLLKTTGESTI